MTFYTSRDSALNAAEDFCDGSLKEYAYQRNFDYKSHANVSQLSPAVRHRLITEKEIVEKVLFKTSYKKSEKFIQEVFWRTYWKGWLEQRPQIWAQYKEEVGALQEEANDPGVQAVKNCNTEIDCINAWSKELQETGYLHNHARMWFASIWIFTLKLPWQLGAKFFFDHLLDGDPASNTLSWRWVAGIQTQGKYYAAKKENIEKYTDKRFSPESLCEPDKAIAYEEDRSMKSLPEKESRFTKAGTFLVLCEDTSIEQCFEKSSDIENSLFYIVEPEIFYDSFAKKVLETKKAFLQDQLRRLETLGARFGKINNLNELKNLDLSSISLVDPLVGPSSDILSSLDLNEGIMREWDRKLFPYAKKGFFQFKKEIEPFLQSEGFPV